MANDASHALGAPELAGAMVNPKGMAKKMTAAVAGGVVGGAAAGVVGGVAGRLAVDVGAGSAYAGAPEVPHFGRVGYVAVTENEVALVKTKSGAFKMKLTDQVLARVARAEVESVELDRGVLLSHLKIKFTNGVVWEFDVPKAGLKAAQRVVGALDGTIV